MKLSSLKKLSKTKTAVIVQCRLSSTRLPGKAMMDLGGKPIVEWTLQAMRKVVPRYAATEKGRLLGNPDIKYVLATDEASAETLRPVAEDCGYEVVVGPLDDVLERFCVAIRATGCDTVVRATADNPFLFYEAAQSLVEEYNRRDEGGGAVDYLTYTGLPHGSGVEVMRAQALLTAGESPRYTAATAEEQRHSVTLTSYDREHVGPALYNHKDKFRCVMLPAPARFNAPDLRTTVDTMADLRRARLVVKEIGGGGGFDTPPQQWKSGGTQPPVNCNIQPPYTTEQILSALAAPSVSHPVLFVPSVIQGQGTGHLVRCAEAAAKLGAFILIDAPTLPQDTIDTIISNSGLAPWQVIDEVASASRPRNDGVAASSNEKSGDSLLDRAGAREVFSASGAKQPPDFALIAADRFALSADDAAAFARAAPLVSLDDGGDATDWADCLIDIIPSALDRMANITESALMTRPKRVRSGGRLDTIFVQGSTAESGKNHSATLTIEDIKRVLVCFGGEDPAHLTAPAAQAVKEALPGAEVTEITTYVPNLRDQLADYDLVVTHYGLTAYEARAAGCAVLLAATTPLHGKLAAKYGFLCLDKKDVKGEKIREAVGKVVSVECRVVSDEKSDLPSLIRRVSYGHRLPCPVCGSTPDAAPSLVVARASTRTYRRCAQCGMLYMSWTMESESHYDADYFGEQYKKQYGKTYLEDFDAIKAQGSRRVEVINGITNAARRHGMLLDVGCAYGPFLSAAHDAGWEVFGTDVSYDAVQYVHSSLLFPAAMARFPAFSPADEFGISAFDAVTMWYVIEHFADLDSVLRAVARITRSGGVFAFSTPSGEGVSAKSDKALFFENSPADHHSVWEPSRAASILKRYGFKVERIVSTGHHAERFPVVKRNGWTAAHPLFKAIDKASRVLRLGDTCEVYCRKAGE